MKKADYIVIALFVSGHCVGALLWSLYFHVASVPILYVTTVLGAWYWAWRNPWWKKKSKRDTEDEA
jgi:hypothetical protein